MEENKTLLIFAPWGLDTGFQLGGAAVSAVTDREALNIEMELALDNEEIGLLALPDYMREWLTEKNMARMEKSLFPVHVFYPCPEELGETMDVEESIGMMVKRVMGYHLKIKL